MCWDCYDTTPKETDFRRGKVEVSDFYEEVNYSPKTKKSKSVKKYPGCPGNDNGPHVFVWTTEKNPDTLFFDHYGFHKWEEKICAGCGHKDKSRKTEEYEARNDKFRRRRIAKGERVWKWISFEDYDEEYATKRKNYIKRYGWSRYISSFGW